MRNKVSQQLPKKSSSIFRRSRRRTPSRPIESTPRLVNSCLAVVVLRRDGRDEIYHAPFCFRCHEPILDLADCNFSQLDRETVEMEPLGKFDEAEASLVGQAFAFHKNCDNTRGAWVPATNVLKEDQRYSFEKRGVRLA